MAITTPISSSSQLFQLPVVHPPSPSTNFPFLMRSKCQLIALRNTSDFVSPVPLKVLSTARFKCCAKSTEERAADTLTSDNDDYSSEETHRSSDDTEKVEDDGSRRNMSSLSDALNLGIREPIYEVC